MKDGDKTQSNMPGRWRWYHGVLFYAGVQAASFGLGKLVKN